MPPLPRLRIAHLLAMTGLYFSSVGFLMHFPRHVLRIGGSAQDAGWLLALGLIPALLLARPVSEWNQRVGGRWPAVAGGVIVAISNVLMLWVAHVDVWMYLLRIVFSIGHTLIFGTLFAQAAFLAEHPARRAQVIGWLAVMTQLGNAIGGTIGEIAYQHGSASFWIGSVAFVLGATILGALWSFKPQVEARPADETNLLKTGWPPEVLCMVAIAMAFSGVTQFLPTFIDHLSSSGAMQAFPSSWFLTTALLMVALVRLVGGYFAERLLQPRALRTCHLILLATLVCIPFMHGRAHAIVLGIGFGLSYGWLYPALNSLAFNRVPAEARGKLAGWLMVAFEIGFRLGPIGMGALITYGGYGAMFFGVAVVYVAILMFARSAARKSPALSASHA